MRGNENLNLNIISNIVYQAVNVLSPLIITPKISRVFGADYLGIKSYTFSIVYYFAVFGVLGLDMYGQRKIALEKDNLDSRSRSFWSIYLVRLLLGAVSILFYTIFFTVAVSDSFEKIIFLCWFIYLFRNMINPIWFLQGIGKYTFISICEIISQLAYLVATFLFINNKTQLPLYIVLYTAIPLAISFVYLFAVLPNVKIIKINGVEMIGVVKESFVYFIPTIATAIYSMIDKTMLGIFDSTKISTGLYEAAEKLVKVALAISTSSFTIMRTKMSYLYGQKDRYLYKKYSQLFISLSMIFCWPIMFGVIGIAKDFIPLFFGDGFEAVVSYSKIFALVVPCLTISGLLQAIYIFPYGLQKKMNYYYIIIVAVNTIMNYTLIQLYGTSGAIISSICAEMLLAFILFWKAKGEIEVFYIFTSSVKYFISAVFMYLYIQFISNYIKCGEIYKVITEFFGGVFVYFFLCLTLKDTFLIQQTKKIVHSGILFFSDYFHK